MVNQGGVNSQFRGIGTINGNVAPNGEAYQFMIWARDASPDTIRIKIWWEDGSGAENTIYDNGFNQALGRGNIGIH